MELHKYHTFFLPILLKLYQEANTDSYIDITDCLIGTLEQKAVVVKNINKSEFAIVKREARVVYVDSDYKPKPEKFLAKILPLGIEYVENFIKEYQKANKKIPPIGFKTND